MAEINRNVYLETIQHQFFCFDDDDWLINQFRFQNCVVLDLPVECDAVKSHTFAWSLTSANRTGHRATDCRHIKAPLEVEFDFVNRKHSHSINVQMM